MRVRGRNVNIAECPPAIRSYLGQSFVTVAKDYEVYALSVFQGVVMLQVVDDVGMPSWRPGWLFDVVDSEMPRDWICSFVTADPLLVIGPAFVAKDEASYTEMVELTSDQVARFWKRIDETGGPKERRC
jgi:hypothetical protein